MVLKPLSKHGIRTSLFRQQQILEYDDNDNNDDVDDYDSDDDN